MPYPYGDLTTLLRALRPRQPEEIEPEYSYGDADPSLWSPAPPPDIPAPPSGGGIDYVNDPSIWGAAVTPPPATRPRVAGKAPTKAPTKPKQPSVNYADESTFAAPPTAPPSDHETFKQQYARQLGVPYPVVKELTGTESSYGKADFYGPEVPGQGKAGGEFQIMDALAKQKGIDVHNPKQNAQAGIEYLREGYERAKRSPYAKTERQRWGVALLHYFGGPGAVDKMDASGGQIAGSDQHKSKADYVQEILDRSFGPKNPEQDIPYVDGRDPADRDYNERVASSEVAGPPATGFEEPQQQGAIRSGFRGSPGRKPLQMPQVAPLPGQQQSGQITSGFNLQGGSTPAQAGLQRGNIQSGFNARKAPPPKPFSPGPYRPTPTETNLQQGQVASGFNARQAPPFKAPGRNIADEVALAQQQQPKPEGPSEYWQGYNPFTPDLPSVDPTARSMPSEKKEIVGHPYNTGEIHATLPSTAFEDYLSGLGEKLGGGLYGGAKRGLAGLKYTAQALPMNRMLDMMPRGDTLNPAKNYEGFKQAEKDLEETLTRSDQGFVGEAAGTAGSSFGQMGVSAIPGGLVGGLLGGPIGAGLGATAAYAASEGPNWYEHPYETAVNTAFVPLTMAAGSGISNLFKKPATNLLQKVGRYAIGSAAGGGAGSAAAAAANLPSYVSGEMTGEEYGKSAIKAGAIGSLMGPIGTHQKGEPGAVRSPSLMGKVGGELARDVKGGLGDVSSLITALRTGKVEGVKGQTGSIADALSATDAPSKISPPGGTRDQSKSPWPFTGKKPQPTDQEIFPVNKQREGGLPDWAQKREPIKPIEKPVTEVAPVKDFTRSEANVPAWPYGEREQQGGTLPESPKRELPDWAQKREQAAPLATEPPTPTPTGRQPKIIRTNPAIAAKEARKTKKTIEPEVVTEQPDLIGMDETPPETVQPTTAVPTVTPATGIGPVHRVASAVSGEKGTIIRTMVDPDTGETLYHVAFDSNPEKQVWRDANSFNLAKDEVQPGQKVRVTSGKYTGTGTVQGGSTVGLGADKVMVRGDFTDAKTGKQYRDIGVTRGQLERIEEAKPHEVTVTPATVQKVRRARTKPPVETPGTGEAPPTVAAPTTAAPEAEAGPINKLFKHDQYLADRERIRKSLNKSSAGIDPEDMAAMFRIGGYHAEKGARKIADWSKRMVDDFGEGIKPHLDMIYAAISRDPGLGGKKQFSSDRETKKHFKELASAEQGVTQAGAFTRYGTAQERGVLPPAKVQPKAKVTSEWQSAVAPESHDTASELLRLYVGAQPKTQIPTPKQKRYLTTLEGQMRELGLQESDWQTAVKNSTAAAKPRESVKSISINESPALIAQRSRRRLKEAASEPPPEIEGNFKQPADAFDTKEAGHLAASLRTDVDGRSVLLDPLVQKTIIEENKKEGRTTVYGKKAGQVYDLKELTEHIPFSDLDRSDPAYQKGSDQLNAMHYGLAEALGGKESLSDATPMTYLEWFNKHIPADTEEGHQAWLKLRKAFSAAGIRWPEEHANGGFFKDLDDALDYVGENYGLRETFTKIEEGSGKLSPEEQRLAELYRNSEADVQDGKYESLEDTPLATVIEAYADIAQRAKLTRMKYGENKSGMYYGQKASDAGLDMNEMLRAALDEGTRRDIEATKKEAASQEREPTPVAAKIARKKKAKLVLTGEQIPQGPYLTPEQERELRGGKRYVGEEETPSNRETPLYEEPDDFIGPRKPIGTSMEHPVMPAGEVGKFGKELNKPTTVSFAEGAKKDYWTSMRSRVRRAYEARQLDRDLTKAGISAKDFHAGAPTVRESRALATRGGEHVSLREAAGGVYGLEDILRRLQAGFDKSNKAGEELNPDAVELYKDVMAAIDEEEAYHLKHGAGGGIIGGAIIDTRARQEIANRKAARAAKAALYIPGDVGTEKLGFTGEPITSMKEIEKAKPSPRLQAEEQYYASEVEAKREAQRVTLEKANDKLIQKVAEEEGIAPEDVVPSEENGVLTAKQIEDKLDDALPRDAITMKREQKHETLTREGRLLTEQARSEYEAKEEAFSKAQQEKGLKRWEGKVTKASIKREAEAELAKQRELTAAQREAERVQWEENIAAWEPVIEAAHDALDEHGTPIPEDTLKAEREIAAYEKQRKADRAARAEELRGEVKAKADVEAEAAAAQKQSEELLGVKAATQAAQTPMGKDIAEKQRAREQVAELFSEKTKEGMAIQEKEKAKPKQLSPEGQAALQRLRAKAETNLAESLDVDEEAQRFNELDDDLLRDRSASMRDSQREEMAWSALPPEKAIGRAEWSQDLPTTKRSDFRQALKRAQFEEDEFLKNRGVSLIQGNDAMTVLMDAALDSLGHGKGLSSIGIPKDLLPDIATALDKMGEAAPRALAGRLRELANEKLFGDQVTYVNTAKRLGDEGIYNQVVKQIGAAQTVEGTGSESPLNGEWIKNHKKYPEIKAAIEKHEGLLTDAQLEREVFGYAMSGELGQTHKEDIALAKQYLRAIVKQHGPKILKTPYLGDATTLSRAIGGVQSELKSRVKAKQKRADEAAKRAQSQGTTTPGAGTNVKGARTVPAGGGTGAGQGGGRVVQPKGQGGKGGKTPLLKPQKAPAPATAGPRKPTGMGPPRPPTGPQGPRVNMRGPGAPRAPRTPVPPGTPLPPRRLGKRGPRGPKAPVLGAGGVPRMLGRSHKSPIGPGITPLKPKTAPPMSTLNSAMAFLAPNVWSPAGAAQASGIGAGGGIGQGSVPTSSKVKARAGALNESALLLHAGFLVKNFGSALTGLFGIPISHVNATMEQLFRAEQVTHRLHLKDWRAGWKYGKEQRKAARGRGEVFTGPGYQPASTFWTHPTPGMPSEFQPLSHKPPGYQTSLAKPLEFVNARQDLLAYTANYYANVKGAMAHWEKVKGKGALSSADVEAIHDFAADRASRDALRHKNIMSKALTTAKNGIDTAFTLGTILDRSAKGGWRSWHMKDWPVRPSDVAFRGLFKYTQFGGAAAMRIADATPMGFLTNVAPRLSKLNYEKKLWEYSNPGKPEPMHIKQLRNEVRHAVTEATMGTLMAGAPNIIFGAMGLSRTSRSDWKEEEVEKSTGKAPYGYNVNGIIRMLRGQDHTARPTDTWIAPQEYFAPLGFLGDVYTGIGEKLGGRRDESMGGIVLSSLGGMVDAFSERLLGDRYAREFQRVGRAMEGKGFWSGLAGGAGEVAKGAAETAARRVLQPAQIQKLAGQFDQYYREWEATYKVDKKAAKGIVEQAKVFVMDNLLGSAKATWKSALVPTGIKLGEPKLTPLGEPAERQVGTGGGIAGGIRRSLPLNMTIQQADSPIKDAMLDNEKLAGPLQPKEGESVFDLQKRTMERGALMRSHGDDLATQDWFKALPKDEKRYVLGGLIEKSGEKAVNPKKPPPTPNLLRYSLMQHRANEKMKAYLEKSRPK